ncbi:MAG: hypothetical protein IPJ81_01370 [Chitinophagaceae bacterium]|nr:hypothetical protein [Chitinophagaceae bacterium]
MIKKLLGAVLLVIVFSCSDIGEKKGASSNAESILSARENMMEADRAFSKLSKEKGMKTAFIEYIDSNGVLLKPNERPIIGAEAIDYLSQLNDSTYILEWEPNDGMVAQSGELGFTYGYYKLIPQAKDTTLYGTYVSVWRKQQDGNWKFVLDSGNEGISEEQ